MPISKVAVLGQPCAAANPPNRAVGVMDHVLRQLVETDPDRETSGAVCLACLVQCVGEVERDVSALLARDELPARAKPDRSSPLERLHFFAFVGQQAEEVHPHQVVADGK
jgi:hypothetical protein